MAITEMNERITPKNEAWQHSEGTVARSIEQQTAKLPSDTFLWAAVAAMGGAAVLQLAGRRQTSLFVGQWVAPFLLFGVYNKLVKIAGSDRVHG
jgi:fatty acid desaturase